MNPGYWRRKVQERAEFSPGGDFGGSVSVGRMLTGQNMLQFICAWWSFYRNLQMANYSAHRPPRAEHTKAILAHINPGVPGQGVVRHIPFRPHIYRRFRDIANTVTTF